MKFAKFLENLHNKPLSGPRRKAPRPERGAWGKELSTFEALSSKPENESESAKISAHPKYPSAKDESQHPKSGDESQHPKSGDESQHPKNGHESLHALSAIYSVHFLNPEVSRFLNHRSTDGISNRCDAFSRNLRAISCNFPQFWAIWCNPISGNLRQFLAIWGNFGQLFCCEKLSSEFRRKKLNSVAKNLRKFYAISSNFWQLLATFGNF